MHLINRALIGAAGAGAAARPAVDQVFAGDGCATRAVGTEHAGQRVGGDGVSGEAIGGGRSAVL